MTFLADLPPLQPITVWRAYHDAAGKFSHNHIEDGHVPMEQYGPTPKTDDQRRAWDKQLWNREWCWMDENYRVVHDKEV